MTVIVDSSLLLAVILNEGGRRAALSRWRAWRRANDELHAPALLTFEIASALTKAIRDGRLTVEEIPGAWRTVERFKVHLHGMDLAGPEIVEVALRLQRRSAYDAAYIALALSLEAEVWTFDGPLSRNAADNGYPVRLLEMR